MPIESVTTCACNYSLLEKSTKRLRALAHLMGTRVRRVYYTFIVHAHVHAYLRVRPHRALDLSRFSRTRYIYGTVPQGELRTLRHLATGCLLLPHTWPGCFLFYVPLFPFLSHGRILLICSSFFLIAWSIKKGTRLSSLEKPFRRVQPASSNPFARGYVCAPREDSLCLICQIFIRRSFFVNSLRLRFDQYMGR